MITLNYKTMKRQSYILSLAVMLFLMLAAGCEKILEVNPKQSVDGESAITTEADVNNLLIAAYEGIKGTGDGAMFGGTFNTFSELLALDLDAPDAKFLGTFSTLKDAQAKALTAYDADALTTWTRAYQVINIVNQVLDHLDLIADAGEQDRVRGEALGIRGTVYFELTRFWGLQYTGTAADNTNPGVPIVLTPTYTAEDAVNVARSSVADCYARAITDLTDAKSLLSTLGKNNDWFSTYAASAILSRIYLQQGRYLLAATEANEVIESNMFALAATPLEAFNRDGVSPEFVFTIKQSATSNAGESNNGIATFYASLNGTGRGDIRIQSIHFTRYEVDDLRGMVDLMELPNGETNWNATIKDVKKMFYYGVGNGSGRRYTSKWGDARTNIAVVRLAEMYLTRAEGNFESGAAQVGPNTPLQDINVTRFRAGLTDLVAVDQAAIRNERYLELCWEGFRLHDLRRWKLDIMAGVPYNAPELVLPIPHREIFINNLLVQNEGYLVE
jgi:hypothetical protein